MPAKATPPPPQPATSAKTPPVALVAIAAWVLPGLGYLLIHQRTRAIVVGVTILLLYMSGLLIGNVRVVDVPGYDADGRPVLIEYRRVKDIRDGRRYEFVRELRVSPEDPIRDETINRVSVLRAHAVSEIANKPWYVGQFLVGPINLLVSSVSLQAARKDPEEPADQPVPRSHARVAEIGTLYTAVAGMLNLMAIIDSAWRAASRKEVRP